MEEEIYLSRENRKMYRTRGDERAMNIKYEFFFDTGRTEVFTLALDKSTLNLQPFPITDDSRWIHLDYHQCSVCPLQTTDTKYCPVARNLAFILVKFANDRSYSAVETRVTTAERCTIRHGSLEEGLSPLMGVIMATSGCPILDKFKPMAYTHLPFANENETMFRAVSTYLTSQYIRMKKGLEPDWSLDSLRELYAAVSTINASFSRRVRELKGKDANINALVMLDVFAQFASFSIGESWVKAVQPYFTAYLKE
jgi:hypothetical protein